MKKLCPKCHLVNFPYAPKCVRCQFNLIEVSTQGSGANKQAIKFTILRRAVVCLAVCLFALLGFYLSLIFTSAPLSYAEKDKIEKAVRILEEKGFSDEVFYLRHLTVYRGNDNWLNASTRLENAYAATNFPFEIMTVYPDFFKNTTSDVERAALLLHEARHLKGENEQEAYEYVWRNRKPLGWTREVYGGSPVWRNVRKQTREYAPNLFVCPWNEADDCTETGN